MRTSRPSQACLLAAKTPRRPGRAAAGTDSAPKRWHLMGERASGLPDHCSLAAGMPARARVTDRGFDGARRRQASLPKGPLGLVFSAPLTPRAVSAPTRAQVGGPENGPDSPPVGTVPKIPNPKAPAATNHLKAWATAWRWGARAVVAGISTRCPPALEGPRLNAGRDAGTRARGWRAMGLVARDSPPAAADLLTRDGYASTMRQVCSLVLAS